MSGKKKAEKMQEKTERVDKAKNKPFDYKTTIWVGLALVALIVVVMLILMFTQNEKIDSSYFHDDENKIVLTMDKDMSVLDDSPWESGIVHVVYYHDGSKITNVRAFYEYPDEETAKIAASKLESGEYADSMKLNGRFIIFQIKKSQYENMTVEELRENIELLKEIDALILDYNENTILDYSVSFEEEDEDEEEEEEEEDGEDNETYNEEEPEEVEEIEEDIIYTDDIEEEEEEDE